MTPNSSENESLWRSGEFENITKSFRDRYNRMQEQLESLKTIAFSISQNLSDRELTKTICTQTSQLMRAERTTLYIVNTERPEQPILETRIAQNPEPIRVEFKHGIAGNAAYYRKIINLKDAYKDKRFDPKLDELTGLKTTSCICAPILIRNELFGVIEVINKRSGYFTLEDEEMLLSLCGQLGVSLAQYRFYVQLTNSNAELIEAREDLRTKNEELAQRNDELQMLYDVERDATRAPDLPSFLERMSSRCLKIFRANYTAIILCDNNGSHFYEMTRQNDITTQLSTRTVTRFPKALTTLPPQTSMALDASVVDDLEIQTKLELNTPLNALLAIRLSKNNRDLGAFIIGRNEKALMPFSTNSGHLFEIVANSLSSMIALLRERAEDEKQRRLTMLGQMMSSLMHDMKTPLSNIQGYSELLAMPNATQEKRENFSKVIERQVDTLKTMISEVLLFSRGETNLMIKPEYIADIIQTAVSDLQAHAEEHHIKLKLDVHFSETIPCDAAKLQRVIINLVKNAIEALGEHGQVLISSYADEEYFYLKIEDDGPGIPPEIRASLFEPFVTRGKIGGTGLGLAIVKKIIDEHKAKITCIPATPHGSIFLIALPRG